MLTIWLFACDSDGSYQLLLDFPDQDAVSWADAVDIWALPPEPSCAALLSGAAAPDPEISYARL